MKFEDVLREYNVPFQTEGKYCRPGWVQFFCPFCVGGSDPNKPYAGFNAESRSVNCWRCGKHSVAHTLMRLTGLSWKEVKSLDLEFPIARPRERTQGTLKLPSNRNPLLRAHRDYLRSRGLKPGTIARIWGAEGIGVAKRLSWRIFIPIHLKGRIVSWTTRSISPNDPIRYISAKPEEEAVPHKTLLYGEDFTKPNAVIVHEGPLDVWKTGPGAVCTFGSGFSDAQVVRISRFTRRIICFDSEPEAQRRARDLCKLLGMFPGETLNVELETGSDACSAEDEEIEELRQLLE